LLDHHRHEALGDGAGQAVERVGHEGNAPWCESAA
jgi:hypothetical protein